MTVKEQSQNAVTCVYAVEGDECGGYRACGTVFAWQSNQQVNIDDGIIIEGPYPCVASTGKVLSVFKVLKEDADKMLKAFASFDEMREAGFAV